MVYVNLKVKADSHKSTQSISLSVDLVDSGVRTHSVLQTDRSSLCPQFELTGSHMSRVYTGKKPNNKTK